MRSRRYKYKQYNDHKDKKINNGPKSIRRIPKTEQNELANNRGQTQVKSHDRGQTQVKSHDRVKKGRIANFIY